jgi:hypothetical protein
MDKFILTESNYHSREANEAYVSHSQYIDFCGTTQKVGCEAYALAKIRGEIPEITTKAMLVGSYVDAYFEGTLPTFAAQHPEIFSTRGTTAGQLKAEYKQAEAMIERATRDKVFMRYMEGDKQVIMTGEIEGVPVRIKMDSFDGNRITDLKTTRSITQTFYASDLNQRITFAEAWGYDIQGALYREVVRQNTGTVFPFYLCAVDKSKDSETGEYHPRIKVIEIPPTLLNEQLESIKHNITKIQDLKNGIFDPIRCEVCDYCADTEVLEGPVSLDMLLGDI